MLKIIGAATPKHEEQLKLLGEFFEVKQITYIDKGDSETLILVRQDGQTLRMDATSNKVDGAFFVIRE